ncbi:MAG: hypothetical protein HC919_11615 [Oscillatoriales cyanobacterium SM2_2_1]|nr:hypothetical protein [Oscillatoriales cyanobacterium SM2_2_1]
MEYVPNSIQAVNPQKARQCHASTTLAFATFSFITVVVGSLIFLSSKPLRLRSQFPQILAIPQQAPAPNLLLLKVDTFGQLYTNGLPISERLLHERIRQHIALYPEGYIVLDPTDSAITYNSLAQIISRLNNSAGDRIAIFTSPNP